MKCNLTERKARLKQARLDKRNGCSRSALEVKYGYEIAREADDLEWKRHKSIVWSVAIIGAILWMTGVILLGMPDMRIGFFVMMTGVCMCAGVMGFCVTN